MTEDARTLGDLRRSGYEVLPVREEMRRNLLGTLARGERILPGIIGYDETVVPEIENAILSGHHIVFLGERGQAKTRIMRGLVSLLDAGSPAVPGCGINDDPYRPICRGRPRAHPDRGDALPRCGSHRGPRTKENVWVPGQERVLDLRHDGLVVADDAREDALATREGAE